MCIVQTPGLISGTIEHTKNPILPAQEMVISDIVANDCRTKAIQPKYYTTFSLWSAL